MFSFMAVEVVGALISGSLALLADAAHILLEGAPPEIDAEALPSALHERIPGVLDVHHIHVWSLSSGHHLATMHVRVTDDTDLSRLLPEVKGVLKERFGLAHTTVQACPEECPEECPDEPG